MASKIIYSSSWEAQEETLFSVELMWRHTDIKHIFAQPSMEYSHSVWSPFTMTNSQTGEGSV